MAKQKKQERRPLERRHGIDSTKSLQSNGFKAQASKVCDLHGPLKRASVGKVNGKTKKSCDINILELF
jgi:hypothetical protein